MTAPGTIRSGVGFRRCDILLLNSDGYPAATSTTVYEGVHLSGAKALTIDDPEPRDIVHVGDDRVFQRDVLPPDTPISGEIRTGKVNDVVDDVITDDKSVTVGEAKLFGFGTDNRGEENQCCVLGYRQTLDTDRTSADYGKRRWEGRLFPKGYIIPRESGFEDTPEERMYSYRPLFVTAYPWGEALTVADEGCLSAQGFRIVSEYKPKIVAWKSDGAETSYDFNSSIPAQAAGKVVVWVNGVEQTEDFTAYTSGVVFSAAPATDAIIVAFYEYE